MGQAAHGRGIGRGGVGQTLIFLQLFLPIGLLAFATGLIAAIKGSRAFHAVSRNSEGMIMSTRSQWLSMRHLAWSAAAAALLFTAAPAQAATTNFFSKTLLERNKSL